MSELENVFINANTGLHLESPDVTESKTELHMLLSHDGVGKVQDAEASLQNYTTEDLQFVTIDLPNDPLLLAQILLAEYISANPQLYQGELTVSGRTLRILDALTREGANVEQQEAFSPVKDIIDLSFDIPIVGD